MADAPNSVEQFMVLAPQLMTEAAEYAGTAETSPDVEGNIRKLKVMAAALLASLNAIRT